MAKQSIAVECAPADVLRNGIQQIDNSELMLIGII